jgi:hypothetical protein
MKMEAGRRRSKAAPRLAAQPHPLRFIGERTLAAIIEIGAGGRYCSIRTIALTSSLAA